MKTVGKGRNRRLLWFKLPDLGMTEKLGEREGADIYVKHSGKDLEDLSLDLLVWRWLEVDWSGHCQWAHIAGLGDVDLRLKTWSRSCPGGWKTNGSLVLDFHVVVELEHFILDRSIHRHVLHLWLLWLLLLHLVVLSLSIANHRSRNSSVGNSRPIHSDDLSLLCNSSHLHWHQWWHVGTVLIIRRGITLILECSKCTRGTVDGRCCR